jgi:hypothetical protein
MCTIMMLPIYLNYQVKLRYKDVCSPMHVAMQHFGFQDHAKVCSNHALHTIQLLS